MCWAFALLHGLAFCHLPSLEVKEGASSLYSCFVHGVDLIGLHPHCRSLPFKDLHLWIVLCARRLVIAKRIADLVPTSHVLSSLGVGRLRSANTLWHRSAHPPTCLFWCFHLN